MPVGRRGSAKCLRKAGQWPMVRSFDPQNEALFTVLGTDYGGNGTTTFNLPDLVGRYRRRRRHQYQWHHDNPRRTVRHQQLYADVRQYPTQNIPVPDVATSVLTSCMSHLS